MEAGHRYETVVARATAQATAQGMSLNTHVVSRHAVSAISRVRAT